jgi:hypothetical protein
MGCVSHRQRLNDEETTLTEQELKLNYYKHPSVQLDYVLRKHSHDGLINAAQFAAASIELGLVTSSEAPESLIAKFYSELSKAGVWRLKQMLLIGLLLGEGQTGTKAELLFEIYDQDCADSILGSQVREICTDLLEVAVTKLSVLVGPHQNGPADPTSVNIYIDRLLINRKSTDAKIVSLILQGRSQITKADFVKALETEELRGLLSSSGFRRFYYKEYKVKSSMKRNSPD